MNASQTGSWVASVKNTSRATIAVGLSLLVLCTLLIGLLVADDSSRALIAAVATIVTAAIFIMISDNAITRDGGDRAFWLGLGAALILRSIAASISAIAIADHTLNDQKKEIALGLNGIAALVLAAMLAAKALPRDKSWALVVLDAALVVTTACAAFAIALDSVGRSPDLHQGQLWLALAALGADGLALTVLGLTAWPFIGSSGVARWLLAGWLLTLVADIEISLAITADDINSSGVYLMLALAGFTLGVGGVFRLTSDPTAFGQSSSRHLGTGRFLRSRVEILVVALASMSFIVSLILIAIYLDDNDFSPLFVSVAAAGALIGLTRLAVSSSQQSSEVRGLRERQIELEQQAMTDSITELPNHRALLSRITEEVERAKRFKQPLSVCFIDVDAFKQINDSLGHQTGDDVLKEIGSMLRANARQIDIVARYGGEEFVILLPGTWTDDALLFAERLREAIAITVIRPQEGVDIRLSVSIGVAGLPEHADDRESLLKRADDAVYVAKRSGRNQVHLYDPNIAPGNGAAFTTEDALRLVNLVEQRQTMASGHGEQVARLAALLATRLGLDASEIDRIYQAGLLHDLGKISVPDSVLAKDGRLSTREAEIVRGHSLIGARLLDGNAMLVPLSSAVRHHHERWDGSGYPYRLAGENIPLAARILAIAEAYAAMTTDTPWKHALSPADALAEISYMSGRQFDPKLVALFARTFGSQLPLEAR